MSKFWKGFLIGIATMFFIFSGLIFYGISISSGAELKEPNIVQINERRLISELKLKDINTLKEVNIPKDQVVFINIWQTWCGPCLREMKSIETLHNYYKNNSKISFYIVSDEAIDKIKKTANAKKIKLPFFINTTKLPYEMSDESIPRTYIILNGDILMYEIGARKWDSPSVISFINKVIKSDIIDK